MRKYFVSLFLLLTSFCVSAADIYSQVDGDFFSPATWSGGAVPSVGDNVFINHNVTMEITTSYIVNSITMSGYQKTLTINNSGSPATLTVTTAISYSNKAYINIGANMDLVAASVNLSGYEGTFTTGTNSDVTVSGAFAITAKSAVTIGGNLTAASLTANGYQSILSVSGNTNISGLISMPQAVIATFSGNVTADSVSLTSAETTINTTTGKNFSVTKGILFGGSSTTFYADANLSASSLKFSNSSTKLDVDPNSTVNVSGAITFSGGGNSIDVYGELNANSVVLNSGSNTITVFNGGEVNIIGNITVSNNANLNVNNSGDLWIGGDLNVTDGSHATITGSVDIDHDLNVSGGSGVSVPAPGYLNVDGAINVSGGGAVTGTGTIKAKYCNGISGCTVLPIELHYFKAQYQNGVVYFDWATFSEENNDFFTIESSQNAHDFEPELIVSGAGNSNVYLSYQASLQFNQRGITYYRLKQTDYNGQFSYSETVALAPHNSSKVEVNMVSVTKSGNTINLELDQVVYTAKVEMVTIAGSIVHSQLEVNYDGLKQLQFNPGNIASGIYIIRITNPDGLNICTKVAL